VQLNGMPRHPSSKAMHASLETFNPINNIIIDRMPPLG
ncbi:MAG: hypothetical protein ACI9TP_002378, partial [Candidatus Azotimanducaceae bacterium]